MAHPAERGLGKTEVLFWLYEISRRRPAIEKAIVGSKKWAGRESNSDLPPDHTKAKPARAGAPGDRSGQILRLQKKIGLRVATSRKLLALKELSGRD